MYDAAVCHLDAKVGGSLVVQSPSAAASSKSKRGLDLLVSALMLIALLPVLLLIAILIRIESRGPALFRQRRGGLLGQPFTVYKFRTMCVMEDGDRVDQAQRGDARITAFGAFLRQTSIDELPQLINVLKGDMSLVGPRPHAVVHDQEFQERVASYQRRFVTRPGITGLAQIRGHRGETRTHDSLESRIAADLEYIDNWSLGADLKLLVATLKVPLEGSAY